MLKSMSSDLVRFGKICAFMDEFGKFWTDLATILGRFWDGEKSGNDGRMW